MAIEFLLVMSMLIVVFLVMLQYAVRAHAERIATGAAQQGLAAASSYRGTAADGERVASDYLQRLGPGLSAPSIAARRTGTSATVTVSGDVDQLVPFLPIRVRVHVEGPIERFVQSAADPANGTPP